MEVLSLLIIVVAGSSIPFVFFILGRFLYKLCYADVEPKYCFCKEAVSFYCTFGLWFALGYCFLGTFGYDYNRNNVELTDITKGTNSIIANARDKLTSVLQFQLSNHGSFSDFSDLMDIFSRDTGFENLKVSHDKMDQVLSQAVAHVKNFKNYVEKHETSLSKDCGGKVYVDMESIPKSFANLTLGFNELAIYMKNVAVRVRSLEQMLLDRIEKMKRNTVENSQIGSDLKSRKNQLEHFQKDLDNIEEKKREYVTTIIKRSPDEEQLIKNLARVTSVILFIFSLTVHTWTSRVTCGLEQCPYIGIAVVVILTGLMTITICGVAIVIGAQIIYSCSLVEHVNIGNFSKPFTDGKTVCASPGSMFYNEYISVNSPTSNMIAKSISERSFKNNLSEVVNHTLNEFQLSDILTQSLDEVFKGSAKIDGVLRQQCLRSDMLNAVTNFRVKWSSIIDASQSYQQFLQFYEANIGEFDQMFSSSFDLAYVNFVHSLTISIENFRVNVSQTNFNCKDIYNIFSASGGIICQQSYIPVEEYAVLILVTMVTSMVYLICHVMTYHQFRGKIHAELEIARAREAFLAQALQRIASRTV